MKSHTILLLAVTISIITSCNSIQKPKPANQVQYTEEEEKLSVGLQNKIGAWAKNGTECYGIVILAGEKNTVQSGKSVKVMIVQLKSDSLKVKVLEDVSLGQKKDCSQLGVNVGYTWWETDGDLFLTREDADNYLKSKGWEFKSKRKRKFKIGD